MENKLIAKISDKNGTREIDLRAKGFCGMTEGLFARLKAANAKAGVTILEIREETVVSNLPEMRKKYNDLNNEGGEGYIPDAAYFKTLPEFREHIETKIYK